MSTDQQTKILIEKRAKIFGYPSSEAFLLDCAPDFDLNKTKVQHEQTTLVIKGITSWHDVTLKVDKDIEELIELLNLFEMTTFMSCQYDQFGYVNITFTSKGFQTIVDFVVNIVKSKVCPESEEDFERVAENDLVKRFTVSTNIQTRRDNRLTFVSYIDERLKSIQTVRWQFLPSDLEKITSQFKELVDFHRDFLESIKLNF